MLQLIKCKPKPRLFLTENVQSATLMASPPLGQAVDESMHVAKLIQYARPHDEQQPFASYIEASMRSARDKTVVAPTNTGFERILQNDILDTVERDRDLYVEKEEEEW